MKIFLRANAKKKTERLNGFKFRAFMCRLPSDINAVKNELTDIFLMYLWWSLCTFDLHACRMRVTVGDSGLCCCTCVT